MTEDQIMTAEKAREDEREAFLAATDWGHAKLESLVPDASPRLYFRLLGGPVPAVLVDAQHAATTPPCPPGATEEERRGLGYMASARLAGNALAASEAGAEKLREIGIPAPLTLVKDTAKGLAVVEEVVGTPLNIACDRSAVEADLYLRAAALLRTLHGDAATPGPFMDWTYQVYDTLAYEVEADLLAIWYLPRLMGRELTTTERQDLQAAWASLFALLSDVDRWVHRDYHAENIFSTSTGMAVIDFQDMMVGHSAYDWASLIEDARRDVSSRLRDELHDYARSQSSSPAIFETDYAILAAQRNAKILGLFTRLAQQDKKLRYLDMMERVRRSFLRDLERPVVRPLRDILAKIAPELIHD
ncbi:MAG: phosphotransferase [Parvularcula sp.]|nr:phosphotransferase [Parvularcula sp.]